MSAASFAVSYSPARRWEDSENAQKYAVLRKVTGEERLKTSALNTVLCNSYK
jgi:hypothetical protein